MKKLSLLLALLLVVSCFVLASCGEEEESSVTETSSTAATSSEAASKEESKAESSVVEEESSEEESSVEESSEPEYVKNPDALSTEGNNVAAGKTYEISEQFRMSTETWGYDETFPPSYPDDNYELTDGYVPTNEDAYSAACWMALHQNTPAQTERGYGFIKIDLGEIYEISTITLTTLKDTETGITCPYKLEYMISEDGENWISAGTLDITSELDGLADKSVHVLTGEVDVTARYIEIRVISYGWAFMGELEVK